MPLTEATADIAATLARHLPAGRVADVPDPYREEPRGRWRGTSATLVRPRTTEEVAEIVRFARAERVGIVPYAGGTGLVGGQTGQGAATILLSVERMDAIEQVDPDGNVAVAGAGAILADVQKAAAAAGRLFPLSLASEGSARIGGLLATNAGGTGVLRHGNARDLCLGVEAVLADGSVLKGPGRLRKDNTGYDLRHLLIGSEGTLGIITRAALRLVPQPGEEATALLSVPGPAAALALLGGLRRALGDELSAFELMARMGFDFLAEAGPETQVPLSPVPDWVVLVEAGAPAGARLAERVEAALGDALEAGTITDALIAQNRAQAAAFWELRERLPEGNRRVGAVASHDISVPIAAVPAFIAEAGAAVAAVDGRLRVNCFGHMGDGNLHYNVFPPAGGDRAAHDGDRARVSRAVHDLVAAHGGSISAEHGIGRAKPAELARYGDPVKLAAMRAIKQALDPDGILNPGAVLPPEGAG